MISGGNATIYVANMDDAVRFYTEVLGLRLTNRFGNHWATVKVGNTLVIGLHPWSAKYPRPGTKGAVQIGLVVTGERITELAARLRGRGVEVSGVIESQEGNYISFTDPDGNPLYVGDWDFNAEGDHKDHEPQAVGSTAT